MIDLTTGIGLSSDHIVQSVTSEPPRFINIKDDVVEYAFGFPNIMTTLWGFVCTFRYFPTQQEFVEHYLRVHDLSIRNLDPLGVTARILRAYPSLVREIHFYSMVVESGSFDSVLYCAQKDVEMGIDLQVGLGGQIYNICCFVMTKRAIEFRAKKRTQRHRDQINTLDMPLDFQTGKNINGWIFFNSSHVDLLLGNIIDYAWKRYRQHPLDLICS